MVQSSKNEGFRILEEFVCQAIPITSPEESRSEGQSAGRFERNLGSALLFPGLGSQYVGMGRHSIDSSPRARELFDVARQILRYDLASTCISGPAEVLDRPEVSHVAVFVASLANLERLRTTSPKSVDLCTMAAGLNVGEYSALVFAGALSFDDALRVVQRRGEAISEASRATPSGMVSILMLEPEQVRAICAQASECGFIAISAYLGPGNIVVSGTTAACERAQLLTDNAGGKAVPLGVVGAFNSEIMRPADVRVAELLAKVPVHSPQIPVYSNVDALPHSNPDQIRQILARQVVSALQWEDSVRNMLMAGAERFLEVGSGKVLHRLVNQINRKVKCESSGEL